MSTQVTYKGNTIANFTNTTKTLKTSGKYMEDDVAITESISLQSKTVTPTNDTQVVTAGTFITTQSGYVNIVDGFSYPTISLQVGTAYSIHIIFEDQDTGAGTYDVWYDVIKDATSYILAGKPLGSSSVYISDTYAWVESNVGDPHGYLTFTIFEKGEADALSSVTVNAMPTGTTTSPTSISSTSATVTTGTNTITLSKTVSVTPRVTTAGYVSSGTAGNTSVSLTANVTTKAAATITPGTTNQTIASGTYLTGTQTISGDANLVAGNIKNGTTIFGVTGTYEGSSIDCPIFTIVWDASYSNVSSVTCNKTYAECYDYHEGQGNGLAIIENCGISQPTTVLWRNGLTYFRRSGTQGLGDYLEYVLTYGTYPDLNIRFYESGTINVIRPSEYYVETLNITQNGTITNSDHFYSAINVNVPSGGKACQISNTVGRATSSTYTAVGPSITVQKAGTYHVYWSGYRSSTSGTNGSQLYINGTAYGSAKTSFNTGSGLTNTQSIHLTNVSLSANDVLTIRARSRGNNYYMYIQDLVIIEA